MKSIDNKFIRKIMIILILVLLAPGIASAHDVAYIKFFGCTVLNPYELFGNRKGEMGENDLKALAAVIADIYHEKGYTEARVKRMVLAKDGGLNIYIDEGVIGSIRVAGADGIKAKELSAYILPVPGEVYNEYTIAARVDEAKIRFNVRAITAVPERDESGALFLSVEIEKKRKGKFYGAVSTNMVYGIIPLIGYYHFIDSAVIDANIFAGFTYNELRKAGAEISLYSSLDKSVIYYARVRGEHTVDSWESRDSEYITNTVAPQAGMKFSFGAVLFDFHVTERAISFIRYGTYHGWVYDTSASCAVSLNDSGRRLNSREEKRVNLIVTGGYENLAPEAYLKTKFGAEAPFFPFSVSMFRVVPSLHISYTTSRERYQWEYVYDYDFLFHGGDFTASKWRNTAGLYFEFEIQRNFLFAGPFANSGYYLNVENSWRFKTGAGLRAGIQLYNVSISLFYVWNVRAFQSGGSFLILASGKF